jgi:hypothetical protein
MEDGAYLNSDDKKLLNALKVELDNLKTEQSYFTKRKNGLSSEDKEKWRAISIRINQISVEIKDLRQKNILEAGK